jgi:integrating conjugative element protein (TIGR03759 family)
MALAKPAHLLLGTALMLLALPDSWAVDTSTTQVQGPSLGTANAHASAAENARFSRSQWGLDENEWTRYEGLMQGIRGSISPVNLSPLEVLGIHADSDRERRDYAARLAKLMQEDTARVLAFAKAYAEEARKLNPNGALIDTAVLGLPAAPPALHLTRQDRVLFFTRIKPCLPCGQQLALLLAATSLSQTQLDIFVVDANSDDDIRAWAKQHKFDPARLKHKSVTLNHDRGTLATVAGIAATVPKSVLERDKAFTAFEPTALEH